MDYEHILTRFANLRPTGPNRWVATCPAHGSGRNRALSIAVKGDRLLFHCFAGCSAEAVLGAVGLRWSDLRGGRAPYRRPAPMPPVKPNGDEKPAQDAVQKWQRWWDGARPRHPLLRTYLQARGLSITPPPSLRLALWGEQPVVLACVTGPDGTLAGLHLTFLEAGGQGRKEKKVAAGSKPTGGAIRLFAHQVDQPLALCEGIETALAVHQATQWPAWACVSAGGLERVILPLEVREVVVCADHDPAGLEAANKLARRLVAEGRKVRLATPPREGADWLDVLLEVEGGVQ